MIRILSAIAAASLLLPFLVALAQGETRAMAAFGAPMAAAGALALLCELLRRKAAKPPLTAARAFTVVGCVWAATGLFGALPLWLSGAFGSAVDALFESVSGFTTTGATVLADVESLPRSVNLWRCQTHWLGGMGVIALAVALLPFLGSGGFRLVKAETTGPEKGKITPRIADTAKALWLVYLALTLLQTLLLRLAGMGWLDALCHAFSTIGTGGFSTRNASVGAFGSVAVEAVVTLFMLLASVNFALYCRLLAGRAADVWRDSEFRVFLGIVAAAIALTALARLPEGVSAGHSLRTASFQVASLLSTTGFMTSDYTLWPPAAQIVLLTLFFVGGCSGSTAGGVKVVRWTLLGKQLRNEIRHLLHPHEQLTLRLNGQPGREDLVRAAAAFLFAYLLLVLATTFAGAWAGLDPLSAFTGALSMVGNVGPAFGSLGPTANCGALPAALKGWYCLAMLAGRLEIYTLLILFLRACRPRAAQA